jgi:hypothetical protein
MAARQAVLSAEVFFMGKAAQAAGNSSSRESGMNGKQSVVFQIGESKPRARLVIFVIHENSNRTPPGRPNPAG